MPRTPGRRFWHSHSNRITHPHTGAEPVSLSLTDDKSLRDRDSECHGDPNPNGIEYRDTLSDKDTDA